MERKGLYTDDVGQVLWRREVKKELLIYSAIVTLSALILHPDLLSEPAARLTTMVERSNYYHPLLFGLGIYLVIGLLRLTVVGIIKIIRR